MLSLPFSSPVSRRSFLAGAGASLAVASSSRLRAAKVPASDKVVVGIVGWGMQGPNNTKAFLKLPNCQVVAACDIDTNRLQMALDTINGAYGNKDCASYRNFHEMIARDDIDAVMIAVPDHNHEVYMTAAAARKKDIFGEKPLAHTIAEQQAIVKAAKQNNIIWQTGSWQRSLPQFYKAAQLVRNGFIGNVTHVEVGLPGGHRDFPKTLPAFQQRLASLYTPDKPANPALIVPGTPAWDLAVTAPPPNLDYETWVGPAEMGPYIDVHTFQNWRWNYNTGGGQLMDWIGHHGDIAHWGLGFDLSGPSEVEGFGEFPERKAIWNTATKYTVNCLYKKEVTGYSNDVKLTISGGSGAIGMGTKWIGSDGWVWVDRSGFDSSNAEWNKWDVVPDAQIKTPVYHSTDHWANFIDSVQSRKPTVAPVDVAHHSTIPGHLGTISMLLGRKIHWDVKEEKILNDPEASAMLTRPYRAPYHIA